MVKGHLTRVSIINFISALIISFVVCYFFKTLHLTQMMHVADLAGLCFLVIFGISILVESGDVRNNYERFILAVALILIFDFAFLVMVPLLFGNVFSAPDYVLTLGGVNYTLTSNVFVYLAVYGAIVLIANYALYLKEKKLYG